MRKIRLFSVCSAMAALLMTAYCLCVLTAEKSIYATARVYSPAPSTGLTVLASQFRMDRTGLLGEEITFSPEDFERALNLTSLTSVTVVSLPSPPGSCVWARHASRRDKPFCAVMWSG